MAQYTAHMTSITSSRAAERFLLKASISIGALSVTSFIAESLHHSVFIEKYKNIVHLFKLGEKVPLDENVEALFQKVMTELKIREKFKSKFECFHVTGFEVFHAGIPSGVFKAIIGVPINFTYEDKTSIPISTITLGYSKEPINIYHPSTDQLLDSLILSEKAKKFAMAREILMAKKELPIYRSMQSATMVIGTGSALLYLRDKFRLPKKRLAASLIVYGAALLFSYSLWFQFRDTLNKYCEVKVDEKLANLGPDYVEGGKEFYEKTIKRNIALRVLLGAQGAKIFNREGDEINFLRNKRTPVTHRKQFFEEFTLPEVEQQPA